MERLEIGNFILNIPDHSGDIEIEFEKDECYDYEFLPFNELKKWVETYEIFYSKFLENSNE